MGEDEVCRMDKRPSTADWRTVGRDNTLSLEHLTTGNALQLGDEFDETTLDSSRFGYEIGTGIRRRRC
jgi:hypothetical protein